MTRIQVKRLKSLMYWVQDRHICQENYDFPDVITQQQFLMRLINLHSNMGREKRATETVRQMIPHKFALPLNNRKKWERWEKTLQDTLAPIFFTNGVPLYYVIRELDATNYAEHGT